MLVEPIFYIFSGTGPQVQILQRKNHYLRRTMDRTCFISVILPLRLDWNPCYRAPEGAVVRGSRVRVQFAHKEYVGVVEAADIRPAADPEKIQPILSVEDLPSVTEEELALWQFIADYYLCTLGEVYRSAYPAGKTALERTGRRIRLREQERAGRREAALALMREKLESRLAAKEAALATVREGTRRQAELRRMADEIRRRLEALPCAEPAKPGPEDRLPDEGTAAPAGSCGASPAFVLSPAQQTAMDKILSAFSEGKIALLHGVTGSGKTEIYMKLALDTLAEGKNVLYLVPEIALSRQLEERLDRCFGDRLLIFHSGESPVRRREVADSLREGAYIVLGTRSALFLPHHDLGLVIVDEEHDTSYKQDTTPRYQGRDTAVMLARIHGSRVLLGSATPSLESLYNCTGGRYDLVTLDEKYHAAREACVEIIDTVAERRKNGMTGSFSRKLTARIRETLDRGEQVILLRGRRAYSPVIQCTRCGNIPKCPCCNVPLSYHKADERLVCHHCGHRERYSTECPVCGGPRQPFGAGTQRIEEEALALFPDARIARLDSDTARDKQAEYRIIRDFAAGRLDILIGTQIVTKGFDFGGLTLVAVLQADSLLGQQDFRADEHAFQLLEQFRGRCARRDRNGRFVIQTAQAGHPLYRLLSGEEPQGGFISALLAERKEFGYPPYSRIILIICRDSNETRLEKMSRELAGAICETFGIRPAILAGPTAGSISLTGPYAPPLDRIAGEGIRHIRLMLRKDAALADNKKRLAILLAAFGKEHRYAGHIFPDVDPA